MKKVFNILVVITLLLTTFASGITNAYASSNTLRRDENQNYKVNFSKDGESAYVNFIYGSMHRINGRVVICLEPDVHARNGASYSQRAISNYMNASTRAMAEKIYYHGFENANTGSTGSENWWLYGLTTKYMIYELIGWEVEIVQWGHSRSYNQVKAEIMEKVNNHDTKPSFDGATRTVDRGETIRLTDSNSVVGEFRVTSNNTGADVSIEGNRLVINTNSNSKNGTITLSKFDSSDIGSTIAWRNSTSQDMGDFRLPSNVTTQVRVNFNEYGELRIEKVDEETKEMLAGAEFKVTGPSNYENVVTTNSSGIARLRNLPIGTYTVVETKSPEGYVLNNQPHTVDVKANEVVKVVHDNAKEVHYGELKILKVDEDTNAKLANAEFRVTGPNNYENVVTTNNDGIARLRNLVVGEYTVVETKAPEGYVLSGETHTVNIEKDKVIEITVENKVEIKYGNLVIEKRDEETRELLAGAEFRVTGPHGFDETIVTGEDGKAILQNIPVGEYTLVETKAPEGYELDPTPRTVIVEEDEKGLLPPLEILNPKTGFIQFGVPAIGLAAFASYSYKKTNKKSAFSRI